MRVSREQAEANHQKIINEASRLFRERGYDGIGLKDLMKAAGLTQGGFYKQFASKDDLAIQATARAIEASTDRWSKIVDENPPGAFEALIAFYLSAGHRDSIARGCPLAALGSDAARHSPELRREFENGVCIQLGQLDRMLGREPGAMPSQDALAALSLMVGALALSRMTREGALSDSFLAAATAKLMEDFSPSKAGGDDRQH